MSAAWLGEWTLLSQRIEALSRAASAMQTSLAVNSTDHYSMVRKVIGPAAEEIFGDLRGFQSRFESSLPVRATNSLKRLLQFTGLNLSSDSAALGNLQVIAGILATASEVNFHLADPQVAGRRLVERAFIHLTRSLAVDGDLRARWLSAFTEGETQCEKLGAVHLLSHGVWGFKVNAAGAATDLILSERPLVGSGLDLSVAEFLVLTEWKRILNGDDVPATANAARMQAAAYAGGLLGGVELRTVRYVVLVSREQIIGLPDDVSGPQGVIFRHLNVSIDPETPSVLGKRAARLPA